MNKIKNALAICLNDYKSKTMFFSALSMSACVIFALYNAFLGLKYKSLWNGTICVYYFLLSLVRAVIIFSQRKSNLESSAQRKRKIYLLTHIMLFAVCLSLVIPINIIVSDGRNTNYGSIPALTVATYTTYRVISSVVHFKRSHHNSEPFVVELRTVNMVDSLAAVLTLQDTLITTYGAPDCEMRVISVWTSAAILDIIFLITILSFFKRKDTFD